MKLMLKPATADLIVRDPATGEALPAEGASVEMNTYWRRRLRDRSVEQIKPARQNKSEKKES